jgi:Fur family peroxide stress response transcriptional regulator
MNPSLQEITENLKKSGLKVTPQRLAVLECIYKLGGHPTTENIIHYIRKNHPRIASGTVYKVLDTLVDKNLIQRVKTGKDIMRYDGILERHHHLFCIETETIKDYFDEELDNLLDAYFETKKIQNFQIDEIKLQISGKFITYPENS